MLTLYDEFSGAGGSTQGAAVVPGVEPIFAANHNELAIRSHAANFPNVDHYQGDVIEADITRFPRADIFWASPACPPWTDARGVKRDFDKTNQQTLFGEEGPPENIVRARALMEEVPRYLRHWAEQGRPVLGGVVENVIQLAKWDQFGRWKRQIEALGYHVQVIAYNSMHARPVRTRRAPQSRDRLFVQYILKTIGRLPDLRKWLSPQAYCPSCDQVVDAMQVFKQPGVDMGRYGARNQYIYRCPSTSCRNAVVEPGVLPALAAIDWGLPGTRIGDRAEPLADKTIARIRAGLKKYAIPLLAPAGGTWRNDAVPVDHPMPARTTRENDGLAVPPFLVPLRSGRNRSMRVDVDPMATVVANGSNHALLVPPLLIPVEGRDGKTAAPATDPLRTQTARNETGLAWLPFLTELRGGSCDARAVTERMATITASGNHLFLCTPENPPPAMVMRNNSSKGDGEEMCTPADEPFRTTTTKGHQPLITWEHLLVPYYGNGTARTTSEPIGTLSTRDRYALVSGLDDIDIDDVLFRMLEPHEIGAAMAFGQDYIVLGNKRDKVRQYGNAVTPPVAEVIVSALVEAITGEDLERAA